MSRRSSLLQPRHDRRAATRVMIDAARARKPKARPRKRRVVASRRSTKLRSWTRTTKPSGRAVHRASGTAVACTWPPGSGKTDAQVVQAAAGGRRSGRTRAARLAQVSEAG